MHISKAQRVNVTNQGRPRELSLKLTSKDETEYMYMENLKVMEPLKDRA